MVLPIWPTSPVPADFQRDFNWGESVQTFDSGLEVAGTPFIKPLVRYAINLTNLPRTKQQSLNAFFHLVKGKSEPFLFMDPYDNRVNATICVQCGSAVRSFFVRTAEGYPVIPASGTLIITSLTQGLRVQGTHYQFNPDTGVFSTSVVPGADETWVASAAYFRKCKFDGYTEQSKFWNHFSGNAVFHEIALP